MTATGPWLDAVHWIGIAAGIIALLAGLGGLAILLFLRKGPIKRRLRLRTIHMVAGGAAVLLALGHSVGRAFQAGGGQFRLDAPHLTTVAFLLIALSGLTRQWTPGFLQGRVQIVWWVHRAAIVMVLAALACHVLHETSAFLSD